MAQISSPEVYADGQQVTAVRMNNMVNGSVLLPGAINDQSLFTSLANVDTFLIYDDSTGNLGKIALSSLFTQGQDIVTKSITDITGNVLGITFTSNQEIYLTTGSGSNGVVITGVVSASGGGSIGGSGPNSVIGGLLVLTELTVAGNVLFNTTEAIKLPVGTTVQRPATPIAGQIRYNSTLLAAEVYNGTTWDAVPVAGTSLTLPNTVNFTGTIQYNGTVVYGLYAVYEETISTFSGNSILFTSSAFTKPSDEIWVFEVDSIITANVTWTGSVFFVNTSGASYHTEYSFSASSFGYGGSLYYGKQFSSRWVVNAGTTLTVETVRVAVGITGGATQVVINASAFSNPNSKFRIYKYRTA